MIVHDTREEQDYVRSCAVTDILFVVVCLIPLATILVMALV